MTPRAAVLALGLSLLPAFALAQSDVVAEDEVQGAGDDVRAIFEGLALPQTIDVMAREGRDYGGTLAETLFVDAVPPADWAEIVGAIYDPERMEEEVLASLEKELAGEDTAAMRAFLEAEPGRGLVELELAAREAMLDDEVEEAAKEAAAVAMADDDPRIELVRRYAEVNDLIETNVVAAMNTNFAYLMGLMDGGAMRQEMTEGDVLADVWAQEPQIRADTTEWVMSFLLMAYEPATDADIEAMIAFSESEPGQALNRAVFEAFDAMFEDISHSLGLASARYMTTQEL